MARELGDVLHYFLDEPDDRGPERKAARPSADPRSRSQAAVVAPIVAAPVGRNDLVRSAVLWNLAVELAREGRRVTIVGPDDGDELNPWAGTHPAPLGARWVPTGAENLAALEVAARERAGNEAARGRGGMVFARVPSAWIENAPDGHPLLSWALLFTTSERNDLNRTWELARRLLEVSSEARVGVTVHGASSLEEARDAFQLLAARSDKRFGRPLWSYGLLVDDLDVYRAIVERRAIGITRPQSRAARALRDVARLLREDAEAEEQSRRSDSPLQREAATARV